MNGLIGGWVGGWVGKRTYLHANDANGESLQLPTRQHVHVTVEDVAEFHLVQDRFSSFSLVLLLDDFTDLGLGGWVGGWRKGGSNEVLYAL